MSSSDSSSSFSSSAGAASPPAAAPAAGAAAGAAAANENKVSFKSLPSRALAKTLAQTCELLAILS